MTRTTQLALLEDFVEPLTELRTARSGTFVDNMALPIHRWFRYSAGFSAQWVEQLLVDWQLTSTDVVLDPFVGSGTTLVACATRGVTSIGVEAHPVIARICKAKLWWSTSLEHFARLAEQVAQEARQCSVDTTAYPPLIQRSFEPAMLAQLHSLKTAWGLLNDQSPAAELVWLAITAILRPCSTAGTAQWQYILPNKTKKKVAQPYVAFRQQIDAMLADMAWMQVHPTAQASLQIHDARMCSQVIEQQIAAVITSPPYANNYDYADALRFEMTFWGEVKSWGDVHEKVRKYLIVSSSQHSSKDRLAADDLLALPEVAPIRSELTAVVRQLAVVREDHGGKKHYHTMIAAYCRDIAQVMNQLRTVARAGVHMCWVIGDSAPYGVYCPIDRWLGELALAAGFTTYRFEKLRDRNIKWKNRKHRVPLKEGLLWIEG